MVKKVGEHITIDIIGTKKEYSPSFFEKLVYKIAKKAKVIVLDISKHKFEPSKRKKVHLPIWLTI